jgi:disulfide bond formation protein DsbB
VAAAHKPLMLARRLALGAPAPLLAGAYLSQYGFGLYPCELCWWQRYGHFAAIALAGLAFVAPPQRLWLALAALAILGSGLIGAFHAGVEYGWWEGLTTCSNPIAEADGDPLQAIMDAPLIRCDEVQWSLAGISLAGFNFLISTAAGLAVLRLVAKGGRNA